MTEFLVTVYNKNTMTLIDEFVTSHENTNDLKKAMDNIIHEYNIPYTDIDWLYEV